MHLPIERHRLGCRRWWTAALVACLALSCKNQGTADSGFGHSVLIEGVPHVLQKPDFCGEADVEMYTRYLGKPITQDQVFAASGMDPARGIREHSLPSFRELTALTGRDFYQGRQSLHYAQARYLLYVLQEADLLVPFYQAMLGRLGSDPTGYTALAQVIGHDMAQFQRHWEAEMLKL